jgi:ABC-2 type transport system permease protein
MSTLTRDPTPRQPNAFRMLVASEIRLAYRYPVGPFAAIGIPLGLLVIFGSIPSTTRPEQALGGISFFNLYVPTLLVFVLLVLGVGILPQQLATYRQQGVLRRMSTTPVSPSRLLAAHLTVNLILAAGAVATIIGLGTAVFNLALPHGAGGCIVSLLTLVLTAAAMLGLGLCAAALAGSPQIAQAITAVLFYPLAFFSGLYLPLQAIHSGTITAISKVLPTGAAFNALHASFSGRAPSLDSLLVLAGWALLSSVGAARVFRWQ